MEPFFRDVVIDDTAASNARVAEAFEISACFAIASISSDLFTCVPFRKCVKDLAHERSCPEEILFLMDQVASVPDRVETPSRTPKHRACFGVNTLISKTRCQQSGVINSLAKTVIASSKSACQEKRAAKNTQRCFVRRARLCYKALRYVLQTNSNTSLVLSVFHCSNTWI